MFDLGTYIECKTHLKPKDEVIARQYAQELAHTGSCGKSLRILDVGTGDGSQLRRVMSHYRKLCGNEALDALHVDCIEPEPEASQLITTELSETIGIQPNVIRQSVENWLASRVDQYDLILVTHTLYHIDRDMWPNVIRGLCAALRSTGMIAIEMVSRHSDIYRFLESVSDRADGQGIHRTYDEHGYFYFSEDVEECMRTVGISFKTQTIEGTLAWDRDDIEVLVERLNGGSSHSSIMQFLAFMFRMSEDDLITIGRDDIMGFASSGKEPLNLRSIDQMFTIIGEDR